VEILMLRRSQQSRFAPGAVVFPGGSVDAEDEQLALRWFGAGEEAVRACAVRELAEETALALTSSGLAEIEPATDPIPIISKDPPQTDALPEIARWITPDFLPVRFDARFFAIAAPGGLSARPDGVEIDRAWWGTPAEILEEHRLWESLMWPTFNTLKELRTCQTVEDVLNLRMAPVPPPVPGSSR
jgi:8-oxo-dGTP pyrophosphatase MutT (NUDIX family)